MCCIFARSFSIWATMFRPSIYSDLEWVSSLWHSSHLNWNFYLPSGVWELCVISFSAVGENPGGMNDCPAGTEVVKDSANVLWQNIWPISQTWLDTLVMLDLSPDKVELRALGSADQLSCPLMIMFTSRWGFYNQGFALDFPIFYSATYLQISVYFFNSHSFSSITSWG